MAWNNRSPPSRGTTFAGWTWTGASSAELRGRPAGRCDHDRDAARRRAGGREARRVFVRPRDAGGQLLGRARVQARNCAFGQHAALFHLRDTGNSTDTLIRLEHCSALLEGGVVVLAEDSARRPCRGGPMPLPRAGDADEVAGDVVLVKQTGPRAGAVVFQSLHGPDGAAQQATAPSPSGSMRRRSATRGGRSPWTMPTDSSPRSGTRTRWRSRSTPWQAPDRSPPADRRELRSP